MDCLVCALDSYLFSEDLCPLAQRSMEIEDGSSTWGLSSMEGKKWKRETSALSPRLQGCGKSCQWVVQMASLLNLHALRLQMGQGLSLIQKHIMFPSLPGQPHKAGPLWGGRRITFGVNSSCFHHFLLAWFPVIQMAKCVCNSVLPKQGSFPT